VRKRVFGFFSPDGALAEEGKGVVTACLLGFFLLASGCFARRQPQIPQAASEPNEIAALNRQIAQAASSTPKRDYTIGAEDLLEITLYDIQSADGEPRVLKARVSASGNIVLPLVGQVKAAGLTTAGLEQRLREKFKRYIRDPQLTVFVKEYRSYRVSVVGYVEKPGVLRISGQKSLLEVIAMAGGLDKEAGKTVQLTRKTKSGVKTVVIDLDRLSRQGDLALNLTMAPGDVVTVPKAGVFYVVGSVKKPGAYPLLEPVTVTQALATAGGPDPKLAKTKGTKVFRRLPNGERKAIPVDLAAIRAGKAEDFMIQENDVIVVPMSQVKFVVDRFIGSIGMGLAIPAF